MSFQAIFADADSEAMFRWFYGLGPQAIYSATDIPCETAGCSARLYLTSTGLLICRECGRAAEVPVHGGLGCIA